MLRGRGERKSGTDTMDAAAQNEAGSIVWEVVTMENGIILHHVARKIIKRLV